MASYGFRKAGDPTPYVPPSWSTGTDAEIAEALEKHYAGEVDLTQYWSVGDERTVHLSAMEATGVGESHVEQDVTFVIMNIDNGDDAITNPNYNYQLVTPINGHTRPVFLVGMKDYLVNGTTSESGYMNSSNDNSGSWNGCARRTWCNNVYKAAVPSTLVDIFKQVKVKTAQTYNGTAIQESQDYFFLPAVAEVFKGDGNFGKGGSAGMNTAYSNLTEFNALSRWQYYETTANRVKTAGFSGSASTWWGRSPYYYNSTNFCNVGSNGGANANGASNAYSLAPHAAI